MMTPVATTSLLRLARGDLDSRMVMEWTCPVPYFGDLRRSKVATLGINPSNREFVDATGQELCGEERRFPTLSSLGLQGWLDATSLDVARILAACNDYFAGNPYDRWFGVLEPLLKRVGASYYDSANPAVHLDLVPYATHLKWGELPRSDQIGLLACSADLLGALLRDSDVELVVLNGRSVIRQFQIVAGVELDATAQPGWDLNRQGTSGVRGVGYSGAVSHVAGTDLGRSVAVAGFNHNLQSSFGVTRSSIEAIGAWLGSSQW
jgi:hypothetical protein